MATGWVGPWHVDRARTRDQTCIPCIGRQIPIPCTTREAYEFIFKFLTIQAQRFFFRSMCYNPLLSLSDAWITWSLLILMTSGWVLRDAHIVTLGLAAVSAGLFLTPSTRLSPWKSCCLGSTLSVQCPCWGDRRPHTVSPSLDSPTSLPGPMWTGIQGKKQCDSPPGKHSLPVSEAAQLSSLPLSEETGDLLPNLWTRSVYGDIIYIRPPGTLGTGRFVNQWVWLHEVGHSQVHDSTNICWASAMCQAPG